MAAERARVQRNHLLRRNVVHVAKLADEIGHSNGHALIDEAQSLGLLQRPLQALKGVKS